MTNQMMNSPRRIKHLVVIASLFAIFVTSNYIFSGVFEISNEYMKIPNYIMLKKAGYWNLTGTPILIDDSDPSMDWSYTITNYEWCSGSGTWSDPYLIDLL